MNNMRRNICKALSAALGLGGISACSQTVSDLKPQRIYSEKLRPNANQVEVGMAVRIDAVESVRAAAIFTEDGEVFTAAGRGVFSPNGRKTASYFGSIPKTLRVLRYPDGAVMIFNPKAFAAYLGEPIHDYRIDVLGRIPDELLDDLRRDPKGALRIKIRLHREGVLLGWDIERRPGFDPKKRDQWGEAVYVAAVHSFAGGDFREAEIINGKAVRKGWYIHPRTKERIETEF